MIVIKYLTVSINEFTRIVEIYDPPMCCSTGLCGPSIDPVLVKTNDTVLALKKQAVVITRYNLKQQPRDYLTNHIVADLLHKEGKKVLPITLVNDQVFKTGEYSSYEELCKALGIEPLKKGKPLTIQFE